MRAMRAATVVALALGGPAVAAEAPYQTPAPMQQVPPVAQPAPGEPPAVPEDYLFSLSGGASRGAYQAGVLYALAAHFRAGDAAAWPPAGQGEAPPAGAARYPAGKLLGLSAVSVGAINAVLAAVSVCMGDAEAMGVDDNPLWRFWQDVDWDRMFPGDRTCGEYAARFPELDLRCADQAHSAYSPDDGVFTIKGFAPLRRQLLRLFTQRGALLPNCRVPITLNFIANRNGSGERGFELGKLRLRSFRRTTAFELRTIALPGVPPELRFCRLPPPGDPAHADLAITLPSADPGESGGCVAIAPAAVVDAVMASVAAPPLLPPHPMQFCAADCEPSPATGLHCPAGTRLCQGQLADGAFFDRNPVSGAVALQSRGVIPGLDREGGAPTPQHPRRLTHVIVDPDARRGRVEPPGPPTRGFTYLRRQVENFTRVSGDLETQMLARYGRLDHARVSETTRFRGIVGDLPVLDDVPVLGEAMRGSAAFFERDFRRFDYYSGIYDGIRWLAEEAAAFCRVNDRCGADRKQWLWGDWLPQVSETVHTRDSAGLSFLLGEASELEAGTSLRKPRAGVADALIGPWKGAIHAAKRVAPAPAEAAKATDQIKKMGAIIAALRSGASFSAFAEHLRHAGVYQIPHGAEVLPPYVANYNEWRWRIAQQALKRIEMIERDAGSNGVATGLAVGQYVAAVRASRASLGFDFGPTTVPARLETGGRATAVVNRLVLPATLTTDWRHGGLKLGWEWASYNWQHVRLQLAGAQLQWQRFPATAAEAWAFGLPSVSFGTSGGQHALREGGVRATAWYVKDRSGGFLAHVSPGLELYWRPLWGRIELYGGVRDIACGARAATGPCRDSLTIGLGLADVNGLLYWLARALTGTSDPYTEQPTQTAGLLY